MKTILSSILITCLSLLLTGSVALAQDVNIKIKVKGLENETMLLAYHYGDKQYVNDTLQFNNKGLAVIEGKELEPGIYMAVFPSMKNNYFEFIIKEKSFTLETDKSDFIGKMKITDSKENELFYDDMRFLSDMRQKSNRLKTERNRLKNIEGMQDSVKAVNKKLQAFDEQVIAYRGNIIKEHPETFYASLLGLMQDVKIPDDYDSAQVSRYWYYIYHYWDHVNFAERGLIRTPVFLDRVKNYHTKILPQIPDTMNVYFNRLLDKTLADSFVFQYTIAHILNHYAKSKIMGMDAIYVNMVLNYYCDKSKVWWIDETQRVKMCAEAKGISPLLIGKTAPNVILPDTGLRNYVNMHKMPNKYKIVYIWDPDCGHCKKETPKLQNEFMKLTEEGVDIGVYGISTSSYEEMNKWKKFIIDHKLTYINVGDPYFQSKPSFRDLYDINSTPTIFLLDEDNKILAKKLGVEQLADFVRRKEGLLKDTGGPIKTTEPEHGEEHTPLGDDNIGEPNRKGKK